MCVVALLSLCIVFILGIIVFPLIVDVVEIPIDVESSQIAMLEKAAVAVEVCGEISIVQIKGAVGDVLGSNSGQR